MNGVQSILNKRKREWVERSRHEFQRQRREQRRGHCNRSSHIFLIHIAHKLPVKRKEQRHCIISVWSSPPKAISDLLSGHQCPDCYMIKLKAKRKRGKKKRKGPRSACGLNYKVNLTTCSSCLETQNTANSWILSRHYP